MDITKVKKENAEEHIVKVEERVEQDVHTTVVLQNISEFGEVQEQIVSAESLPYILKNYAGSTDSNLQIAQVDDGQYTYIIENPEGFEEGAEFELADGEHYIIEEYHEEEPQDDPQYETVYIQHIEPPEQGTDVETTEIYTISEELESHYSDEENQLDDDDQQMAIVEESDVVPEEHITEEKPLHTIIQQENIQVKIKQILQPPEEKQPQITNIPTVQRTAIPVKQAIKQEIDLEAEDQPSDAVALEENVDEDSESVQEEVTSMPVNETSELEEKPNKDWQLIFECSICGKGFKTPTGVKRHISISHWQPEEPKKENDVLAFSLCPCCGEPSDSAHTTGDFKCELCEKLFIQQNSLDRHVSIEHPDGDKYECYDCKKSFKVKDQLIEHTRVHSLKSVKCEECGREFSRKYHLDRHIVQTGCMGVPKQVYDCRVCSKSFTRKDNLAEHLKVHAGIMMNRKKKRFTCEFCMKEFNGAALLNIHVRTHTGERPYGCDICEKKFPSSGAMKKHRRMHTGEKPYSCPQCGNKFAAKETLNRHWRTHTGEKPHQCKFCGKSFIQAAQLRAHIFHHTGENAYTCPHCNRAFNRKLRLTTHIKFMHEGAEPLNCPHEGCNKTFFRKEDIHRHVMTHSGEKPYSCEVCGKAFVVKSSLKIHQLTHRKEQPVSCEVCSRAFIRQDCLMRHMRARHRDVLEDIVSNAEKKRLRKQLFRAVTNAANKDMVKDTIVWNELTLTESIKELLSLLVDEDCLSEFGHPEAPVDKVLESVIKRCGHAPASESDFDYIGKMRENAKLLFTVVIDDQAVKELLNNQTVDEVIMHVLKLAKKQAKDPSIVEEEEEINTEEKPNIEEITIDIDDATEKTYIENSKKTFKNKNPKTYPKRKNSRIEYVMEGSSSENDEAAVDNPDSEAHYVDAIENVGSVEEDVDNDNEENEEDIDSTEEVMETERADNEEYRIEDEENDETMEVDDGRVEVHVENAE